MDGFYNDIFSFIPLSAPVSGKIAWKCLLPFACLNVKKPNLAPIKF